ncbi:MAG: polyprenyl synthetase family protein [Oscillospiraceae bacterium]|nr:polyprenyl synthetase family protein [Oscillospiraceae bacterium]
MNKTTKRSTSPNGTLTDILDEYRAIIEKELEIALTGNNARFTVEEAMKYSTLEGGKRIRGVLVLEFCRIFGGKLEKATPIAAAIEMIQAFSLIHDDLPCMDDDDFRRGKPSCHKEFSEPVALLAGDALLANAFNTVSATAFLSKKEAISHKNTVLVMSALSNAIMEMVRGQQLDMDFESAKSNTLDEDAIIGMYNRKTCALISGACVCGAICASASDKDIHKAKSYGIALGLAFQMTDDLLDLENESKDKKTFATLFGAKKTNEKADEYTDMALKIAKSIPDSEFLQQLATMLIKRTV